MMVYLRKVWALTQEERQRFMLIQKVKPKFCKARPLRFALREATDIELDRLVANGTLTPIENSEWATPTVVVSKACSKVRICGDFKVRVKPVAEKDRQTPSQFQR